MTEPSAPVFYNSSNLNSKIEIGEPVQWWCYAHGIPSPTIFWYKVSNIAENRIIVYSLYGAVGTNLFYFRTINHYVSINMIKGCYCKIIIKHF